MSGSTSYTRLMIMDQVEIKPGLGPLAANFWASSADRSMEASCRRLVICPSGSQSWTAYH